MIFKQDDIAIFSDNVESKIRSIRFHKPTGVYFARLTEGEEFLYFEVAQLNSKGETIDKKTFDGKTQKSFFEAVDYFEQLVEKREPQPEQEDPNVGIFVYIKGKNSFADVLGSKVVIDREDVEKVFTPPVKKKYGRLNMYAVENERYDAIKGKFALNFDEQLTELLMGQTGEAKEEIFVYKMTPYETSESGEESGDPEDVNDEEMSLDEIEGEEADNMNGENAEQDGDGEDGEGQDGDGEDGDGDGDGEKEGGDDFNNESGEELESGEGGAEAEKGDPQEMNKEQGTYKGEGTEDKSYEETEFERVVQDEIPARYLRTKNTFEAFLGSYSRSELQEMFKTTITSKDEFIKSMEATREKLMNNE